MSAAFGPARLLALCSALAAPHLAFAGSVEEAVLQGSVTMNIVGGEVKGCTYRSTSISLSGAGAPGGSVVLDASFGLHDAGFGLAKGGALRAIKDGAKPTRTEVMRVESFWIKAPGTPATKPLNGKVIPSDSPVGYQMYAIDLATLNTLIAAVVEGQQLLVGVRLRGQQLDTIHSGVLKLSEHDQQQAASCFEELTSNILKRHDAPKAPVESSPQR